MYDDIYILLQENNYFLRENNRLLNELKDKLTGPEADAREFSLNVVADIYANQLHFGSPRPNLPDNYNRHT